MEKLQGSVQKRALEEGGTEKLQVHNWFRDIISSPSVVTQPETVQDIISIVKDTTTYPSPVRAIGSYHSTTPCGAGDNGTSVDMRKMNRIVGIRSDTVTVQAGALFIDVAKELQKHNRQFYVNVEIGNLTMGSAACAGTKEGSFAGEFGQVCSYCCGMKFVTPAGEIVEVTEEQPELLQIMRSSFGLLGIIYEVTFKIKPLQPLAIYHQSFSLDEFVNQLPKLKARGEGMVMYLNVFANLITVEFRRYREDKNLQKASSWQWQLRNIAWQKLAPSISYYVTKYVPSKSLRYFIIDKFHQLVSLVLVLIVHGNNTIPTDKILRYPEQSTNAKFTFSIWTFPEDEYPRILRAYFQFCHDYYRSTGYRVNMFEAGYRVNADTSALFSYSANGTVLTIDPVSTGNPGWQDFLAAYNEFCSQNGGVPVFNQTNALTRAQVDKAFGDRIATFEGYRKQYDPTGRLLNDYFRKLLT